MRRVPPSALVALTVAIIFFFYPGISLFQESPILTSSWTVQDPIVSLWTFQPGLLELRHELFAHTEILWSSLRNTGAPILSNNVQVAPLYPLTLALIWVPDPYYWNAFVLARLVLLWLGSMLLAIALRMSRTEAIVFAVCFAGSLFVSRWINHPWQNGLAAGVWFLFFSVQTFRLAPLPWGRRRFFNALGIAIAAYATVTCGFPEAAALTAVLAVLIVGPIFVAFVAARPSTRTITRPILDLALGTFTGAILAAPQVFALIEQISQTAPGFRKTNGLVQFPALEFLTTMVARFREQPLPGQMIQIFGLTTLTLAAAGAISSISRRRIGLLEITAALTIVFYILKAFPVWPWFNQLIASLPLMRESWFTVYFAPVLIFGVSVFAARGMRFLVLDPEPGHAAKILTATVSLALVGVAAWLCAGMTPPVEARQVGAILFVFALFVIALALAIAGRARAGLAAACFIVATLAILQEARLNRPAAFLHYGSAEYARHGYDDALARQIRTLLTEKALSVADVRESSADGRYVGTGIATVDDGATAILTQRAQRFRTALFDVDWDGYLPLKGEKRKDAYRFAGRNLAISETKLLSDGVRTLAQVGSVFVQFDERSPGRAFTAAHCRAASGIEDATAIMQDGSFAVGDVVVEDLTEAESAQCARLDGTWRRVGVAEERGSSVRLQRVHGPAILTLNDSFYPGWRAFDWISGAELAIRPGNLNFRSIFLPDAKDYQVEFRYRPPWLTLALVLVSMAIAAWIVVAFVTLPRRRKGKPDSLRKAIAVAD